MLLCIDIGNTNIKIGLFAGEYMRARWRIATDRANLADELEFFKLKATVPIIAVFAFVAGYSERFIVGALGKVSDMAGAGKKD